MRTRKKIGAPRCAHHVVNVSDLDCAFVSFQDATGRDLLSVNFDRLADKRPMINVNAIGQNGDAHAGFTLFDLVA